MFTPSRATGFHSFGRAEAGSGAPCVGFCRQRVSAIVFFGLVAACGVIALLGCSCRSSLSSPLSLPVGKARTVARRRHGICVSVGMPANVHLHFFAMSCVRIYIHDDLHMCGVWL